jgi:hypothetical protein
MTTESDPHIDQTDDQRDILECIAKARERAGEDDRAFVRYLNDCYAAKMQVVGRLLSQGACVMPFSPH